MSQGPLCPNLSQKVQKEVSQMANRNLSPVILLGGLSVNLNHLKTNKIAHRFGSILLFRKFSGEFWDILTQFVKTGSSHPQMHLLDKFYTQSN